MTRTHFASVAFLLLAGLILFLNLSPPQQPLQFSENHAPISSQSPAFMEEHRLIAPVKSAHSATLVKLANGQLSAFWFAGSREGARDVQIWQANEQFDHTWSKPEAVMSAKKASHESFRYIRKLGNPVAMVDGQGHLHLLVVAVSAGGWSVSRIIQMVSSDNGETWGTIKPLVLSPLFNISNLVRAPSIPLVDGGVLLPVYHESVYKYSEILHFDAHGQLINQWRMNGTLGNLQPAIAPVNTSDAVAVMRNAAHPTGRKVLMQRTLDGGRHWDTVKSINLENPNASVALVRLSDGHLLMAYNPHTRERSELALALSSDGEHWKKVKTIARSKQGEYSYPTLLVDGEMTHLVYTWNRKEIRHMRFNRQWLLEKDSV